MAKDPLPPPAMLQHFSSPSHCPTSVSLKANKFTLFSMLPVELQEQIWEVLLMEMGQQLFRVKIYNHRARKKYFYNARRASPAFLANKLAHDVYLRVAKHYDGHLSRGCDQKEIRCRGEMDIIHVTNMGGLLGSPLFSGLNMSLFEQVQKILVCYNICGDKTFLHSCKNLKVLGFLPYNKYQTIKDFTAKDVLLWGQLKEGTVMSNDPSFVLVERAVGRLHGSGQIPLDIRENNVCTMNALAGMIFKKLRTSTNPQVPAWKEFPELRFYKIFDTNAWRKGYGGYISPRETKSSTWKI